MIDIFEHNGDIICFNLEEISGLPQKDELAAKHVETCTVLGMSTTQRIGNMSD